MITPSLPATVPTTNATPADAEVGAYVFRLTMWPEGDLPIALRIDNLSKETLGADRPYRLEIDVQKGGKSFSHQFGFKTPEGNVYDLQQIPNLLPYTLEPEGTASLAGSLCAAHGALPSNSSFNFQATLKVAPEKGEVPVEVDRLMGTFNTLETFQDVPAADLLIVADTHKDVGSVRSVEKVATSLGLTTALWDLDIYDGISLEHLLHNGGTLGDHFAGKTIVLVKPGDERLFPQGELLRAVIERQINFLTVGGRGDCALHCPVEPEPVIEAQVVKGSSKLADERVTRLRRKASLHLTKLLKKNPNRSFVGCYTQTQRFSEDREHNESGSYTIFEMPTFSPATSQWVSTGNVNWQALLVSLPLEKMLETIANIPDTDPYGKTDAVQALREVLREELRLFSLSNRTKKHHWNDPKTAFRQILSRAVAEKSPFRTAILHYWCHLEEVTQADCCCFSTSPENKIAKQQLKELRAQLKLSEEPAALLGGRRWAPLDQYCLPSNIVVGSTKFHSNESSLAVPVQDTPPDLSSVVAEYEERIQKK